MEERRKKLGLMTLADRRERGDLIEVYKILKGLTRIDPAEFWEVREARNGVRLIKELATNGRRQRHRFFSYRMIQKWNLLPTELKMAHSGVFFACSAINTCINRPHDSWVASSLAVANRDQSMKSWVLEFCM